MKKEKRGRVGKIKKTFIFIALKLPSDSLMPHLPKIELQYSIYTMKSDTRNSSFQSVVYKCINETWTQNRFIPKICAHRCCECMRRWTISPKPMKRQQRVPGGCLLYVLRQSGLKHQPGAPLMSDNTGINKGKTHSRRAATPWPRESAALPLREGALRLSRLDCSWMSWTDNGQRETFNLSYTGWSTDRWIDWVTGWLVSLLHVNELWLLMSDWYVPRTVQLHLC